MRNGGGRAPGGEPRTNAGRNYDRDRPPHKIAGKLWKFVEPTSRKRVLELKVLTFDKSEVLETQAGCNQKVGKTAALAGTDNSDYRYRLLRERQHRPCRCCATYKTEKLTPPHIHPWTEHRTDFNWHP